MFQKRKKFVGKASPEKRLLDRWDQQVFFITKKYPQSEAGITAIIRDHESKEGSPFIPSEQALGALAELYSELKATTR